jgi:putrescine aminotransferase
MDPLARRGGVSGHPAVDQYARHVNPAFVRVLGTLGYGRVFVKAKGMHLWDHEGRRYLDFLAGFGAVNLGHNPSRLIDGLIAALKDDLPNVLHVGPQPLAGELAEELARRVPGLPISLFANGGGEAVEEALKLARAATGRRTIVHCSGGFHGMGLGSLSVMGHPRMRSPFEPLIPECVSIPFGDLDALESALKKRRVAAFVLEPIQAEAGVILAPPAYLRNAQALCREHGALLVLDEVQTGIGRTGRTFAFEHERGLCPDILVLGKALGGSMAPLSVAMAKREHVDRAYGSMKTFDLHGSTFAGNAFACRAGLLTLRLLDEESLSENAARMGTLLVEKLRVAVGSHPFVRDIRGKGLLVGIELGPKEAGFFRRVLQAPVEAAFQHVFGQWLAVRLLEEGILCQPASQQWNVLKLEPPLVVNEAEIDELVGTVARVLGAYEDLRPLALDVSKRFGRQMMDGWSFP